MDENRVMFVGMSVLFTVFSVLSIVELYLLARIHIDGFLAFAVTYVSWLFVIAGATLWRV